MNTKKEDLDKFGFSVCDRNEMEKVFRNFPELEKVILFGSRAMNTFKPASDVDIALIYKTDDYHIVAEIKNKLEEETKIPYFFDVLDFKTIDSPELKEHVKLNGMEIYSRV